MNRDWVPTAIAGAIAIVLVWLAGDPLALRPQDVRPGGPLWWAGHAFLRVPEVRMIEPRGDVEAFPARFRWGSFPGATSYEFAVGLDSLGTPAMLRQGAAGTSLEIAPWAGESVPAPGNYVWEIRARRGEEYVARGLVRFRVTSPP